MTAIYTALVVWIIGLAVPVTASYIICAVIAAPALIKLGVPDFAAHMFIFYYAVLSEVSPPTALSPFAAAAITGGDPYKTTLQAWKYTLPAFLVPFVFVLDPQGIGLLMKIPKGGSVYDIVWITAVTARRARRARRRRRKAGQFVAPRRSSERCSSWRAFAGVSEPAGGHFGDGSPGSTFPIRRRSGCARGRFAAMAMESVRRRPDVEILGDKQRGKLNDKR